MEADHHQQLSLLENRLPNNEGAQATDSGIVAESTSDDVVTLPTAKGVPTGQVLLNQTLPYAETPEGRLLDRGVKALSGIELLSIIIGKRGRAKMRASQVAEDILSRLDSTRPDYLGQLRDLRVQELEQVPGITRKVATRILAAVELGQRVHHGHTPQGSIIEDPADLAKVLSGELMWQPQEKFAVVFTDVKHRIIGKEVISKGTATETVANPRDIFRAALKVGATRIFVAHNHPSGSLDPSAEDIQLTRNLLQGGKLISIPVLDHLILGRGDWVSIRQVTDLWNK